MPPRGTHRLFRPVKWAELEPRMRRRTTSATPRPGHAAESACRVTLAGLTSHFLAAGKAAREGCRYEPTSQYAWYGVSSSISGDPRGGSPLNASTS